MKAILRNVFVCLFTALLGSAQAEFVTGRILCDANGNRRIDAEDTGLAAVTVMIVNESHSFSNSTVTATDGSYSVQIPVFDPLAAQQDPLSQIYDETVDPSTLPSDATVIIPQPPIGATPFYAVNPATDTEPITFVSAAGTGTNGDWLISSASCSGSGGPPPPSTNQCRLTGSGSIKADKKTQHSFSGSVSSKANKKGSHGQWSHTAKALKLKFKSTTIDTVSCDGGTDGLTNSANSILFSGQGTLKSRQGKKTVSTPVSFTAAVEDRGNGKKNSDPDTYYIRVFDGDGNNLLLVTADETNPETIVPVAISKGNLRIKPGSGK